MDEDGSRAWVFGTSVVSVATLVACLVYRWWKSSPIYGANVGPKVFPILGSHVEFLKNIHRRHDWVTDYIKHSPTGTIRQVVVGGKALLHTAHPGNVEHILKTKFDLYPKGDRTLHMLEDLLGHGIFNVDGEAWKSQRKTASYEFTTRSLRDFLVETLQHETSQRLLPFLLRASTDGSTIDMQDVFTRFAFDNVCQLSFGLDPKCLLLSNPDVKFAKAFDKATRLSARRFVVPGVLWRFEKAFNLGAERELKQALDDVHDFAIQVIQQRRKELSCESSDSQTRPDLLSRFILGRDTSTDVYLRDIITSFVLAGKDTTSAGLAWFMWRLSLNPEVVEKIRAETSSILQARTENPVKKRVDIIKESMTNPATDEDISVESVFGNADDEPKVVSDFTFEELRQMQYLHAAITESLRLHPPIPSDSKIARVDDLLPDGTLVPKGTRINFYPYAMGRMKSLWGEDCMEYKPDRWLDVDGNFVPANQFKFPVFQAGPRICLGKEMAMTQMKFIVASFLHSFNFRLSDPNHAFAYEPFAISMGIKGGLKAHISRVSS